jgi:hypothetical protein
MSVESCKSGSEMRKKELFRDSTRRYRSLILRHSCYLLVVWLDFGCVLERRGDGVEVKIRNDFERREVQNRKYDERVLEKITA